MLTRILTATALALALVSAPSAQDAKTVIAEASAAMGVDTLRTVQYSATGFDFVLGQAVNPASPWPRFTEKSYTRSIDFETPASRVDRVRAQALNPPRGGGQQPIVGDQQQSQTIIVRADTPWVLQLEIWMTPHGFLRAAAARNATMATRTVGGVPYRVVTFMGANNARVNGYINAQNRIDRVETWIDNALFGDMLFESVYSDYKNVNGVQFPMHIVQRQHDYPILDLTVSDVKINTPVTIQPPQGRGGAPVAAAAPAAPPAQSEKLGDGVYFISGGYSVIAVDFKDYIALIECGQSEARALAVIAEAKRLIPNKRIRYLINTHSHIDHSSGLRAFVAEGSTILTHQINKAYLEKVLRLPHTISPDKAQSSGMEPRVEGMGDKKVLTDGSRVLELYHLKDFGHHDGMIVAYFPREKVLLEADAYNPQPTTATPPNPPSPYTISLVDNIQRLKLDVQRIIPVHYPADNRVVSMAELLKWIGRS